MFTNNLLKLCSRILLAWILTSLVVGISVASPTIQSLPVNGVEEPSYTEAIDRLEAEELDIYALPTTDATISQQVNLSPDLESYRSFTNYNELTFNPSGPIFAGTGKLNPFAIPAIREAMNWLIDRDLLSQEVLGGMAIPRYFTVNQYSSDYTELADIARALELKYAYNKQLARQIISQEMSALGATLVNSIWHYAGDPVEIILLIRIEDDRLQIGDYVGDQLEEMGFVTIREYKTSSEASPIWWQGDPSDGLFHIYTGGWVFTNLPRDLGGDFEFFYTPRGYLGSPLWQAYSPDPEFDSICEQLALREFTTLEERQQWIARALELSMKDSVRIWLVDRMGITPRRAEVSYASDLYGGIASSWLWPYTIARSSDNEAPLVIASSAILYDPWNPLDGSSWIYDTMYIKSTSENAIIYDPYTGLARPQRMKEAYVTVQQDLAVRATLDWVTLNHVPEIKVPEDAWVAWDAEEQHFITVGEFYPEGLTALRYSKVIYEDDLYDKVSWHDGSPFSIADVVMGMILWFDRANQESDVYDESLTWVFESQAASFRGVRILTEDPLVIETWSDAWEIDAESNVSTWWPGYFNGTGFARAQGAWHNTTLGIMAEADGLAAFSSSKADSLGVPRLNYLVYNTILADQLEEARLSGYIPYAPTLTEYVDAGEANSRWENLATWLTEHGHFWIGTGPYYLDQVSTENHELYLEPFLTFPDAPGKWITYLEASIPELEVDGPSIVTKGDSVTFTVDVMANDIPYDPANVEMARYLVISQKGVVVLSGDAQAVAPGVWQITLNDDQSKQIPSGDSRLEVVITSNRVVGASFAHTTFTTLPYELFLPLSLR